MTRVLAILLGMALVATSAAVAQDPKEEKPNFAEPKKDWKWDEDKRFDFLMERLASLEASLDAVNTAIAKASGKRGAKQGEARRAEAGNSAMDRKGGGPMKWNEFYGTTAEKFFYHPVDPNTTYHTSTVLSQVGTRQEDRAGDSVQGNSGVPVHQRPPQFDYIYRANRDAKERAEAEAAAIKDQLDVLNDRRVKLEAEQADLWGRLAFRAIQRLNIPRRPELRFHLVAKSTAPDDQSRARVLEAAARFLVTSLLIIDKAEKEQSVALGNIEVIVTAARSDLTDVIVNESEVTEESEDRAAALGQFMALAQLLEDTANNLSESYEVATEGDRARDRGRKVQFRALLQRSLIEYAQIIMALNELMPLLREQWDIRVDTRSKLPPLAVDWGVSQAAEPSPPTDAAGDLPDLGNAPLHEPEPEKAATTKTRVAEEKRAKLPVRLGNSIQPIPEPKGLAKEIAERLPTRDELDLMRNAVNLPYTRVQEVKSQYLRRIYSVYDADRWTFVDICYLINLHAALSKITGEDSVELPLGNGGSRQGTMLARYWLLRSPNERAFVERRQMLDKDTRDWFDSMVSEEEIKRWLLQMDRPMERNTEKAKALDNLLRAGVTTTSVSKLRRTLQTAVESGQR